MLHSRSEVYKPSLADAPLAAAGLVLRPVPGQRAYSARHKRAHPAPDDAELLQLGERLEVAWGEEEGLFIDGRGVADDAYNAAVDKTKAVLGEIQKLRATTLAGLLVKMRAASWCHSGDPIDAEWLMEAGWQQALMPKTSDVRMIVSILGDLAALMPAATPSPAVTKAA